MENITMESITDEIALGDLTAAEIAKKYNITEEESVNIMIEHDRLRADDNVSEKEYMNWCRVIDQKYYK